MKTVFCRTRLSSLSLFFVSLLLASCGTSKFTSDTYAARDKDRKAFVQTQDGVITEASEVKLRSPFIGKSTIELDNDVRIPVKEVVAYQNNNAYYRKITGQFAPRIKKGLINMYMTSQTYTEFTTNSNGSGSTKMRTRYYYWLQKGNNAEVVSFSPDAVRNYVSDYAPAMDFMNTYDQTQKKAKMWSIINTASVFGGLILAMTAGVKNDNVTAAGYGGVGLFFGGFVNGFVNKIRKIKNQKNLELAVTEYNYQENRKKRTAAGAVN